MSTPSNTTSTSLSVADRLAAQQKAREARQLPATSTASAASTPASGLEDALAQLAKLQAENASLREKAAKAGAGRIVDVSVLVKDPDAAKKTKGRNIAVYGLQRFPVSLYPHAMMRFIKAVEDGRVESVMASEFGRTSFRDSKQRDETAAFLRERGYKVSDEAIASATLVFDAE